jgi:hypothetical protein
LKALRNFAKGDCSAASCLEEGVLALSKMLCAYSFCVRRISYF